MQKSGVFVSYRRVLSNGVVTSTEYVKQIMHRISRADISTGSLAEAVQLDKKSAFKQATMDYAGWSVGELISDAHGIRVEE